MSRNIREYEVFKLAHELVLKIYKVTKQFPTEEKYGLVQQMRRSSYSIPMNLIEGGMRNSEKDFLHFVNIAQGSLAEIVYQLDLSKDLGYIDSNEYKDLVKKYESVGKMLSKLSGKIRANSQKPEAQSQ